MENGRRIILLDTTLRDGDQTAGYCMMRADKLRIAGLLEEIGVDIIEAGFPSSSPGQFDDAVALSGTITRSSVSVMARALPGDIVCAAKAVKGAKNGYIHITVPVSPQHREFKLRMERGQILEMAVEAVRFASGYAHAVEIGAEDATRAEPEFLLEFCRLVAGAGADVVNIADTVGYSQPGEFFALVNRLYTEVEAFRDGRARLSVHCHNDLGLAVANTLSGLSAGAMQAEVTLLGIGERGGNAALEEVVAALAARGDYYAGIRTSAATGRFREILSRAGMITGTPVVPHKPVAGRNAFTHNSGMHQQGMLASSATYSILSPPEFGFDSETFTLSRHSGLNGFKAVVAGLGIRGIADADYPELFSEFKRMADQNRDVNTTDLLVLLHDSGYADNEIWRVRSLAHSQSADTHSVSVEVESVSGRRISASGSGRNVWDTVGSVMMSLFGLDMQITEFSFNGSGVPGSYYEKIYLTARYAGALYSDSSSGENLTGLFASACLNILNRIMAANRSGYGFSLTGKGDYGYADQGG